ncbi:hypothetical protein ES705_09500 [subsurface metagenome]
MKRVRSSFYPKKDLLHLPICRRSFICLIAITGITVDPDEMALEVGDIVTFEVFAHYSIGEPQDITTACVYDLLTTGVIEVRKEEKVVVAEGSGTDTILISYTENNVTFTANIAVTVSAAKIPMTITADIPTFRVGGPYWFTILMTANDDFGKLVVASFDWPISETDVQIAGTLETDETSDLNFTSIGDVFKSEEFTMEGVTTANFRGTFDDVGSYSTTIEVKTTDGISLCSEYIEIVVEEAAPLAVGDSYEGGIVAYIEGSGEHGLIAATADATLLMAWSNIIDASVGTTGTALGTGQANTTAIVGQSGCESGAAYYCDNLIVGVYDDWFLPSLDELDKLYDNRNIIGGFTTELFYWSSSEFAVGKAWVEDFDSGLQNDSNKPNGYNVRAVRAF